MACVICGAKTEKDRRTCDACRESILRRDKSPIDTSVKPPRNVPFAYFTASPTIASAVRQALTTSPESANSHAQEARGDAALNDYRLDEAAQAYMDAIRETMDHLVVLRSKLESALNPQHLTLDKIDGSLLNFDLTALDALTKPTTLLTTAPVVAEEDREQPQIIIHPSHPLTPPPSDDDQYDLLAIISVQVTPRQVRVISAIAILVILLSLFMLWRSRTPQHVMPPESYPIPIEGRLGVPAHFLSAVTPTRHFSERSI